MSARTNWRASVDGERIDHVQLVGDHGFRRQQQGLLAEGRVERVVGQHLAHGVDEDVVQVQASAPPFGAGHAGQAQQAAHRQALAGFPAVDRVAVVAEQVQQFGVAVVVFRITGRRKVAQDRGRRLLRRRR